MLFNSKQKFYSILNMNVGKNGSLTILKVRMIKIKKGLKQK